MKITAKLSILSAVLSMAVAACGPAPEPGETPDPTLGPDTMMVDTVGTDTMMTPPPDNPAVR